MSKKIKKKFIAGLILFMFFVLLLLLCLGYLLYLQANADFNIITFFEAKGSALGAAYFQSYALNAASVDASITVPTGFAIYLSYFALALCLLMMILKKAFIHLANVLTAFFSIQIFSVGLCGVLWADQAGYGSMKPFFAVASILFLLVGAVGFMFMMLFAPKAKEDGFTIEQTPEETPQEEEMEEDIEEGENQENPIEPEPIVEETPEPTDDNQTRVVGKYEVFPEAGLYKYRLKANNGEILIVSMGYATQKSAVAGIATLKKNIPEASTRIVTDKNGFSQFRISSANDSRLIATGEIYPNERGAVNALASVMKFYDTDKIVTLDSLPEGEVREWEIDINGVEHSPSGKLLLECVDKKWIGKLLANNGETLFVTSTYSTKKALQNALYNLVNKFESMRVTIVRDKQNRYQFRVFSENGMLLVVGETFSSKDKAISSAHSMWRFLPLAKVEE